MPPPAIGRGEHGRPVGPTAQARHLGAYAGIVGAGLLALAAVLLLGRRIDPVPTVPASLTVDGPATACLGAGLVPRQVGSDIDVHLPGAGGTTENPAVRNRVGGGHLDRATGRLTVRGTCPPGTADAGRDYRVDLDVEALERGLDRTHVVVGDQVRPARFGGERPPAAGTGTGHQPLAGTELAGRTFLTAATVIVLARAAGSLFARWGQPRVIGEIVAGIMLGPSLVGTVLPDATEIFFPTEVVQVIGILAQFGLIFFMFLVGLELDLGKLSGSGRVALMVSHVSIVAPFVLGVLASLVLFPLIGDGDFASFALFMGAAMSITAFPVLARILSDTGLSRTPLGTLAIACAAVDDVTAWCVLSIVVAIAHATGAADVVTTIGLTLVYVALMLTVVRRALVAWLERLPRSPDGHVVLGTQTVAALIALALVGAWATEEIGIHGIFGAFLVGVAMPRGLGVVEALTAAVKDLTEIVLLPLFFVVAGLSTRVWTFDSALLWLVTAGVIVLAVGGKWGGSTLAARGCGMPWPQALRLGVLMNTRGLTEIVVLTIGLDLGIISTAVFTAMVLMALVTTVMAVPALSILRRYGEPVATAPVVAVSAGAVPGGGVAARAEAAAIDHAAR